MSCIKACYSKMRRIAALARCHSGGLSMPSAITSGLVHIAYNIIVHKHHGQIQVASKPGETRFRVVLPVWLARD